MTKSRIFVWATAVGAGLAGLQAMPQAQAQTPAQVCGQQYQAAKAANTLNGMTWNQFRTDCAAKLKAQPAAVPAAAPAPAPKASIFSNPLKLFKPAPAPAVVVAPAAPAAPAVVVAPAARVAPAVVAAPVAPAAPAVVAAPAAMAAPKAATPLTGGRAAFVERERQCGAEWRAQKVALTAQTPGLTWPQYLSQCNARLKGAGQ